MAKADWDLYRRLLSELPIPAEDWIASAGSSDIFNLARYDSPSNYGAGVLFNESTFDIAVHEFDSDLVIVTVNPFDFPSPPRGLLSWAWPSVSFHDRLLSVLNSITEHYIVVVGHFPALLWYPNRGSTSTSAFADILLRWPNTRFYLGGHIRPEQPRFFHHGDTFEVVGTALCDSGRVGVISFDNFRAAYHSIDIDGQGVRAIITSPAPADQVTGLDAFSEDATELRVVVFSDRRPTLSAVGNVTGELTCIPEGKVGVWLCSVPFRLPAGQYSIGIVGDWQGNVSFVITSTMVGFQQEPYVAEASSAWGFVMAWIWIVVTVVGLPVQFIGVGDGFIRWINGREQTNHWIFAIFGGFLAVQRRFSQAPNRIRMPLFLTVLGTLIIPISFFRIEKAIAILWNWGFVCLGRSKYIFFGMRANAIFLYFVIAPILMFGSAVSLRNGKVLLADTVVYVGLLLGWAFLLYELTEIVGVVSALTSPLFVFLPLYLHGVTIHWAVTVACGKESPEQFDQLGFQV
jgi:hypothetical protein